MHGDRKFGLASPVGSVKDVAFGMFVFGLCILVLGIWMLLGPATGPTLDGRYAWLNRWLYDSFGPRGEAGALVLSGIAIAMFGSYRWLKARSEK